MRVDEVAELMGISECCAYKIMRKLNKELEQKGIGRPSTYAPTISTIIDREYIEKAEDFIKNPFINEKGRCKQCDKSGGGIGKKGKCSFKKTYTIDGIIYMKCAGENYYFANHDLYVIPKYIELIETFYPVKIKNQTK